MSTLTEFQQATLDRALADTKALSPFVGLKADLCQVDVPINQATLLATLVAGIATYTGYAQGVVTWALPSVSAEGIVEVVGTMTVFRPTDGVTPNVIYVIYFTESVSGALAFAQRFDNAPLSMGSALNQIEVTIRYRPATQSIIVVVN